MTNTPDSLHSQPPIRKDIEDVYTRIKEQCSIQEAISLAGMVYWNLISPPDSQNGLVGRSVHGIRLKDIALGLALGPAGIAASVASDSATVPKCTVDLGILVIGSLQVYLVKLGTIDIIEKSGDVLRWRSEVFYHFPQLLTPKNVIAFRPSRADASGSELSVEVLDDIPTLFDQAFKEQTLVVDAPGNGSNGSFGAELLALHIRDLIDYPHPEKMIMAFQSADNNSLEQNLEDALADADYIRLFVNCYRKMDPAIRAAWILHVRTKVPSLMTIAQICAQSPSGTTRSWYIGLGLGLFLSLPSLATIVTFIDGAGTPKGDVYGHLAQALAFMVLIGTCLSIGIVFLLSLYFEDQDRRFERRLLADGTNAFRKNVRLSHREFPLLGIVCSLLWLPCFLLGIYLTQHSRADPSPSIPPKLEFLLGIVFGFAGIPPLGLLWGYYHFFSYESLLKERKPSSVQ